MIEFKVIGESKDLSSLIDLRCLNDLKTLLVYRLMAVGYKVYTFKVRFAILWKCSGSFTTYVISNSRNGILLPKFFCPTVRKKISSDREKRFKSEAEG